jgi:prophage maintenance system killer protein
MTRGLGKIEKIKLYRTNLPNVETLKAINLRFLTDAKNGVKDSKGDVAIYHLFGSSYNQMRRKITNLSSDNVQIIDAICKYFPENTNIFCQCAYYYRAFSRSQIFPDANHRTGYFSLQRMLEIQGLEINADNDEVVGLTEYIRGQGWLKMGDIMVRLTEKDDEYKFLRDWFKEKLKFR